MERFNLNEESYLSLLEGTYKEAFNQLMTCTKKELLKFADFITDFEGHNWRKEDGVKAIISNEIFKGDINSKLEKGAKNEKRY